MMRGFGLVGSIASVWLACAMVQGQTNTGSVDRPARVGMAGFPVVFYTPETSAGIGGGLTLTFRPADAPDTGHPDHVSMFLLYTLNQQVMGSVFPQCYLGENWKIGAALAYRDFPDEYYGLGNDTREGDAEDFTTRDVVINPYLLRRVVSRAWAGVAYDWKNTDVLEIEADGLLAGGGLAGTDGSRLSGLGPMLEWDSRDQAFAPRSGALYRLIALFYRDGMGSENAYDAVMADGRHYWSTGNDRVVAVQWRISTVSGGIPFNEYARLDDVRGVLESRYRARKAAMVQAEYRFPVKGRFSGVTFVSAGEVMDRWGDASWSGLHAAGGVGLRFALNREERINLRLDLGFGEDGLYPYIRMMEAF